MDTTTNAINWFEVPVTDMERARKFYESVFDIKMDESEMMGMKMAFFPYEMGSGKLSGALVQGPMHQPSTTGCIIYFNANPDLSLALSKVELSGGKVTGPKTKIGDEVGFMAFFIDSEGNSMAMHSQQ